MSANTGGAAQIHTHAADTEKGNLWRAEKPRTNNTHTKKNDSNSVWASKSTSIKQSAAELEEKKNKFNSAFGAHLPRNRVQIYGTQTTRIFRFMLINQQMQPFKFITVIFGAPASKKTRIQMRK